jgi:hypothetical protein
MCNAKDKTNILKSSFDLQVGGHGKSGAWEYALHECSSSSMEGLLRMLLMRLCCMLQKDSRHHSKTGTAGS